MSREKIITCDKCKIIMDESDKYSAYHGTLKEYSGNSPEIEIDLCWDCSRKLITWLKTKK